MLEVPLSRLQREASVEVDARVPADHAMWEGLGMEWVGPVDVHLGVSLAGSGEVIARGHVHGTLAQACRRCLEPLERAFDEDVTIVFVDEKGAEQEDVESGGTRVIGASVSELDLSGPVREEVFLAIEPYVVCHPECKGLCPGCGANLNEGTCSCSAEEADPRWDALRKLKEK
jgi:uncharacterized protein